MKKYLEDLQQELKKRNMSENEIADILADHKEMIESAIRDGMDEADIRTKFGDPAHVAAELSAAEASETETSDTDSGEAWKSFPLTEGIKKIEVELVDDDVEYIGQSNSDVLEIKVNGKFNPEKYEVEFSSGVLKLNTTKQKGFSLFNRLREQISFTILVPENILIGELAHKGVNSDMVFKGVKIAKSKIITTNGDVTIENSELGESSWNTVNGDFNITKAKFESIDLTTVSGDIELKQVIVAKKFSVNGVSGDVKVSDTEFEEIKYNSVSGDFEGKECYAKTTSFRTVSGDVTLDNKTRRDGDTVKHSSVSGDIQIH
ncbi:MAG: DUF4097 family beta strand repeat protein [Bacilli bacterium]|nr:DUF4097 family beta strand repeat protein [Bacilli bacterium]MBN2696710.1 DUF4097 family beta strand repeat protein [Bacilli bacterium]